MRYLLDTNVLSDLIRNPDGVVARAVRRVDEDLLCTSIVVAAELRFGARKKASPRLAARVESLLGILKVLPLEAPVDEFYARIRLDLELAGHPIGANDLLIAAQALSLELTIVTDNEREFSRVVGLGVENWLRA